MQVDEGNDNKGQLEFNTTIPKLRAHEGSSVRHGAAEV
jgi:hypothetical protein